MKTMRESGYTLVEIVVVIGIVGILAAISVPNFMDRYRDATYREQARRLYYLLVEMRTQAIQTNVDVTIKVEPVTKKILLNDVARDTFSDLVIIKTTTECDSTGNVFFHFNPNGTSSAGYVCIETTDGLPRYRVGVTSTMTGRPVIERCNPSKAPECL